MKDWEKLRLLADWFDYHDSRLPYMGNVENNEVQKDLRRIAQNLEDYHNQE